MVNVFLAHVQKILRFLHLLCYHHQCHVLVQIFILTEEMMIRSHDWKREKQIHCMLFPSYLLHLVLHPAYITLSDDEIWAATTLLLPQSSSPGLKSVSQCCQNWETELAPVCSATSFPSGWRLFHYRSFCRERSHRRSRLAKNSVLGSGFGWVKPRDWTKGPYICSHEIYVPLIATVTLFIVSKAPLVKRKIRLVSLGLVCTMVNRGI